MGSDKKNQYAGYWIRRFLCEYLVTVKNMSANTQKAIGIPSVSFLRGHRQGCEKVWTSFSLKTFPLS